MSWQNFSADTKAFKKYMRPHIKRFFKKFTGHSYINIWREACGWPRGTDKAGYYFGHWLAFTFPLLIIALVVGYII